MVKRGTIYMDICIELGMFTLVIIERGLSFCAFSRLLKRVLNKGAAMLFHLFFMLKNKVT
jgi:hypothetical protein